MWGRGGVVVSALDFRSEGRWFDAQSRPSWGYGREFSISSRFSPDGISWGGEQSRQVLKAFRPFMSLLVFMPVNILKKPLECFLHAADFWGGSCLCEAWYHFSTHHVFKKLITKSLRSFLLLSVTPFGSNTSACFFTSTVGALLIST